MAGSLILSGNLLPIKLSTFVKWQLAGVREFEQWSTFDNETLELDRSAVRDGGDGLVMTVTAARAAQNYNNDDDKNQDDD